MTTTVVSRSEYVPRAVAALLLAAGWLTLGYALRYSPSNADAIEELEGGGSFGVAFGLTVPYYAMSLGVLGVALLALVPRVRNLEPLAAAVVGAGLFGLWALNWRDVYGVLPDLPLYALAMVWLVLLSGVAVLAAHRARGTATPGRSSRP